MFLVIARPIGAGPKALPHSHHVNPADILHLLQSWLLSSSCSVNSRAANCSSISAFGIWRRLSPDMPHLPKAKQSDLKYSLVPLLPEAPSHWGSYIIVQAVLGVVLCGP